MKTIQLIRYYMALIIFIFLSSHVTANDDDVLISDENMNSELHILINNMVNTTFALEDIGLSYDTVTLLSYLFFYNYKHAFDKETKKFTHGFSSTEEHEKSIKFLPKLMSITHQPCCAEHEFTLKSSNISSLSTVKLSEGVYSSSPPSCDVTDKKFSPECKCKCKCKCHNSNWIRKFTGMVSQRRYDNKNKNKNWKLFVDLIKLECTVNRTPSSFDIEDDIGIRVVTLCIFSYFILSELVEEIRNTYSASPNGADPDQDDYPLEFGTVSKQKILTAFDDMVPIINFFNYYICGELGRIDGKSGNSYSLCKGLIDCNLKGVEDEIHLFSKSEIAEKVIGNMSLCSYFMILNPLKKQEYHKTKIQTYPWLVASKLNHFFMQHFPASTEYFLPCLSDGKITDRNLFGINKFKELISTLRSLLSKKKYAQYSEDDPDREKIKEYSLKIAEIFYSLKPTGKLYVYILFNVSLRACVEEVFPFTDGYDFGDGSSVLSPD
ncbi:MAG: hypothetical protein PUP46_00795 [Endozoicomonas sp. (ex Botrylloides leachii)]|nr:hypothetical protein [Endozoicomonas sp. (ex Botrylloides leachii)]